MYRFVAGAAVALTLFACDFLYEIRFVNQTSRPVTVLCDGNVRHTIPPGEEWSASLINQMPFCNEIRTDKDRWTYDYDNVFDLARTRTRTFTLFLDSSGTLSFGGLDALAPASTQPQAFPLHPRK